VGLGSGGALAAAEVALRRLGVVPALLVGAALSPMALLGSVFELAFAEGSNSHTAALEVGRFAGSLTALGLAGHVLAHLFVGGPFLVALWRRATLPGQCVAMGLGATLWCLVALVLGPWTIADTVDVRVVPLLLQAPCLVLPVARQLGDRLLRRALRRRSAAPVTGPWRTPTRVAAVLVVSASPLPTLALRRGPTISADDVRAEVRVLVFDDVGSALHRPWRGLWMPLPRGAWLGSGHDTLLNRCGQWSSDSSWFAPVGWSEWWPWPAWIERAIANGDQDAMQELAGLIRTPGWGGTRLCQPQTPEEHFEALGWLRQLIAAGRDDLSCLLGERLVGVARHGLEPFEGRTPRPIERVLPRGALHEEGLAEELRAREDKALLAIEDALAARDHGVSPLDQQVERRRSADRHSSGVGSVDSAR